MLAFIASSLFVAAARGHMIMANPKPYDSPAVSHSPIDSSNFPCQLTAGQTLVSGSASNTFALGSEQELSFIGQATHGGGSCQVSITYDKNPSATSSWKVIQSIEGGCPAQGQVGNMGNDASAVDPYTYNFTVPDNIPTGDVTLAWTWFNKIGNREMYMNCAPVTLTGTSGSEANFNSLPDMFVANIDNGCSTTEGSDLLFPNPGEAVVSMNIGTSVFSPPVGTCQTATPAQKVSDSKTATPAAATTSTPAAAASTKPGAAYSGGGVFITVSSSAAAAPAATSTPAATSPAATSPAATSPAATSPAAVATPSAAAPAAGTTTTAAAVTTTTAAATGSSGSSGSTGSTGSSGSTGSAETAGSACSPEGTWNCLGSSYQQCASGVWSVVQQMAAGTSCTAGKTTALDVVANSRKHRRQAARFAARMAPRIPRRR